MRRLFFPIVFLIAATGFFFGGSIAATFFSKPTIIEQQINYSQNSPTSQSENHQPQSESFWVRTLGDPIAFYTFGLFLFTAILAASTIGLLWQTRKLAMGAEQQSEDMKASIDESAKSAVSLKELATNSEASVRTVREATSMQMRAYINVVTGAATFQERPKDLRFAASPIFVNTGNTPAHNVRFVAKAAILKSPPPDTFDFSLAEPPDGGSVIGPHHQNEITRVIDHFVPDEEVADIKLGTREVLYVWGIVIYEDVFKVIHKTRFCQFYIWLGTIDNPILRGFYSPKHNDAD